MTALGDVLGWAALGEPLGDDDGSEAAEAMGADILATPEMTGLRDALRALDQYGGPNYLEYLQVPDSVLEWIREPNVGAS